MRLLVDAADVLGSGAEALLVVACHRGVARLAASVALPEGDTAVLGPLLTGEPAVASHIRVALEGARGIARRAGRSILRLSVPARDVTTRDIAEALGYELTGAGATVARPELDLPGRDTWTLTADATRSRGGVPVPDGPSLVGVNSCLG